MRFSIARTEFSTWDNPSPLFLISKGYNFCTDLDRFVSDTITQDIVKFRSLQPGEDARVCDLVHLANQSCYTLKEVGNQNDMNNNHMLSIIEQ